MGIDAASAAAESISEIGGNFGVFEVRVPASDDLAYCQLGFQLTGDGKDSGDCPEHERVFGGNREDRAAEEVLPSSEPWYTGRDTLQPPPTELESLRQ